MGLLEWDKTGEKLYETGVDRGVLYPKSTTGTYPAGVAWNGLTNINESPSGAEPTPLWADNNKYLTLMSAEEYACSIEAYMYPDEFKECDGSKEIAPGVYAGQQNRKGFGLAYRSIVGNDTEFNEYGYKLHLVYDCLASVSETGHSTVNDNPEAATFSWNVSTTPVACPGAKPTACLTIDSTKYTTEAQKKNLAELEKCLFGYTPATATEEDVEIDPFLPMPADVIALINGTKTAADLVENVG